MSYNPYGGNPYGAPPAWGNPSPTMGAPPGLGPPPGMSSAPGMSPAPGMAPPGIQQSNAPPANRPGGLPPHFQPPTNMPNINFNAPVIRLGTTAPSRPNGPGGGAGGRSDGPPSAGGRPGLGMERGHESRQPREHPQVLVPPSSEEKLRMIFVHQVPDGVGGDAGIEMLLASVGHLRKWDAAGSEMDDHKGQKFGFALYEDPDSVWAAVRLLHDETIEVPLKRQQPYDGLAKEDDSFDDVEKVKLQVRVDETTQRYIESHEENRMDTDRAQQKLDSARTALRQALKNLFRPPPGTTIETDKDTAMGNADGENVEVVNIPLAQDDELADIPAEMRAVVAGEIAAFRERSIQRDMERLKKEEEMEEMERRRHGAPRPSRLDSPPASNIPSGPRASIPVGQRLRS